MRPDELRPRIGTCLYAVLLWIALGGRLRVGQSESAWYIPHFSCEIDGVEWSFEPINRKYGWRAWFDLLFIGRWHRVTREEFDT